MLLRALLFVTLLALPARAEVSDRIVASFSGQVVAMSTLEEYRTLFFPQLDERHALVKLIDDRLILEEATRYDIKVSDGEVGGAIAALRDRLGGAAALADWQSRNGVSDQELKARVHARLLVDDFLDYRFRNWVRVTPAQIQDAWSKNPAWHAQPLATVQATIKSQLTAEALQKQVENYLAGLHSHVSLRSLL